MITNTLDLYQVIERMLNRAMAKGATEAEIYVVETLNRNVVALKDKLENASASHIIGIGLRVVIGKKIGIHGTTALGLRNIDEAVDTALSIARVAPEDKDWVSLAKGLGKSHVFGTYDKKTAEIDLEQIAKVIMNGIETAKNIDKRIEPLASSGFISINRITIANSYGELVERKSTKAIGSIEVKVHEATEESVFGDFISARSWEEHEFIKLSKDVAEKCLTFLRAKKIKTEKMDVVLRGKVFGALLETLLAPAISASNVQRHRSPLVGKLNEHIFSDYLTILDDGIAEGLFSSAEFDDEGIPTTRKYVVEKGILKTYLYDTYTANKDKIKSTGNAYRRSISSSPIPWVTNLIVIPGMQSLDSIIKDVKRGILVYSTIGYWLSNPISGQLSATVTHGYLIEDGEVKHPIKGIVISDDFYELMKSRVVQLSKEVENYMGIYAPHIHLRNVQVAGD